MKSIDVANTFISRHGGTHCITNLKLNKLVFYAQVESLKKFGVPLFPDEIQAWGYGPVEPNVYRAFKKYGRGAITSPSSSFETTDRSVSIVDDIFNRFAETTAFDLVTISHRPDGAWAKTYSPDNDEVISADIILSSADLDNIPGCSFTDALAEVERKWPNALKMLEDA